MPFGERLTCPSSPLGAVATKYTGCASMNVRSRPSIPSYTFPMPSIVNAVTALVQRDSGHRTGYRPGMSEDPRVESRAELLPEEREAGSADPEAQAEAILRDSDEREAYQAPEEHRTSDETAR